MFLFLIIFYIPKLIQTFSHAPPEWLSGFDVYDPVRCGLSIPFEQKLKPKQINLSNINRSKRRTILDSEFKVLGGENVREGEYPWAVYLINPILRCTGVLISKRHVLTAAHCFRKKGVKFICKKVAGEKFKSCCSKSDAANIKTVLSEYFIQVGSICIGEEASLKNCKLPGHAIKYTIKNAIYNHYFENNCIGRDYAIIELGHPIPLEKKTVEINLNKNNEKITIPANIANHICLLHLDEKVNKLNWRNLSSLPVVFGWGQTVNINGKMRPSSFLQKAKLISLMKQKDCKNNVKNYHEDLICVISKKNISTCAGDSGGGLASQFEDSQGIKRWFLLGVTSMGVNCSRLVLGNFIEKQTILMDTNVYYYRNVIDEIIGTQENQRKKWKNLINFHALEFC